MDGDGRGPRRYDSSARVQQAAERRLAIAAAAHDLFVEGGYPATTMDIVAERARVSLKTVYNAYGTKSALLKAVWNLALKGDLDEAPVASRSGFTAVLAEPDPQQQLAMAAEGSRIAKTRIGPMLEVMRDAAASDEELRALWDLIQTEFRANQQLIVESLAEKGALRAGLDIRRATDLLWTLNHPDLWLLLVVRCGWSPQEWQAWFVESCRQQLLTSD